MTDMLAFVKSGRNVDAKIAKDSRTGEGARRDAYFI